MSNPFNQITETFGGQEGLCEAGIFALTPEGWLLLSRRKFTQMGTATEWGKQEMETLRPQHDYRRYRMSVVTGDHDQSLEQVLAEYETKRKAGDPQYNVLPLAANEVGGTMAGHLRDLAKVGACQAFVCIELQVNGEWRIAIAARKNCSSGIEANQWAHYHEEKQLRRKEVKSAGTVIAEKPTTDAEAIENYRANIEDNRKRRNAPNN